MIPSRLYSRLKLLDSGMLIHYLLSLTDLGFLGLFHNLNEIPDISDIHKREKLQHILFKHKRKYL